MSQTRMFTRLPGVLLLASTLWVQQPVGAQVERSGGGANVNGQLYQDYQQAVTERTQLQSDNAKLKSDLAEARQQLAAARQQLVGARNGAASNQSALVATQAAQGTTAKSLAALREQSQELISRFRDTIAQLRDVETDRSQLRQQIAENRSAYEQCVHDNEGLFQLDNTVLDLYAHQGMFSHLARAEPFTRIERTRLENIALEYRQRAEALHLPGSTPSTGASSGPGAATPATAHP